MMGVVARNGVFFWSDGSQSLLGRESTAVLFVKLDGENYQGNVFEREIHWNDGEVWVSVSRLAEEAAQSCDLAVA